MAASVSLPAFPAEDALREPGTAPEPPPAEDASGALIASVAMPLAIGITGMTLE
jgi:hypothetical protein